MIEVCTQSEANEAIPGIPTGEHYRVSKESRKLALFGVVHPWHGVARAYFDLSEDLGISEVCTLMREIRKVLNERNHYYARIECTVREDSPVSLKFAHNLGFVDEGIMQGYDPKDQTAHVMMRFENVS